jgi:DNA-binding transcriptional LysR family regulator
MNLTDLHTFSKVAETGTVSGAAALLKLPKSTVSRRIQRLEDALGVTLFQRKARNISLSEQGLLLHQKTVASLKELMDAKEHLTNTNAELRGPLRITTTPGFGQSSLLVESLISFGLQYPMVTLELSLTERVVDLSAEGFDIGIRLFQDSLPGSATTMSRMLTQFTFGLYASPGYLAQHPINTTDNTYLEHRYIGMSLLNLHDRQWVHEKTQERKQFQFSAPKWQINNFSSLRQFVLADAGLAVLENYIAGPLVDNELLIRIAPEWKVNAGKAALVWPSSRYLKPSVRAFIDHMTKDASANT